MSFQAHITYRGPLQKKVSGLSGAVKSAMADAMVLWHQDMLPTHFVTQSAYDAIYGSHQNRGPNYMREKAKKYGHQNMCEYSGELKRNVTRGITISGTSKEVRGRLPGSQKANYKRVPSAPDVRDEMTAVSQKQAVQLTGVVDAKVTQFLNSNEDSLTVSP
jgi:hypothetical protein